MPRRMKIEGMVVVRKDDVGWNRKVPRLSRPRDAMTIVAEDERRIHESVNVGIRNGDRDEPRWVNSDLSLLRNAITIVAEDERRSTRQ
jgi:hypothetical protein